MSLTLAITDNADGTGATATIAGAGAADTVTVYTQAFDGDLGTGDWDTEGTRTGDGTFDLTLDRGHYFAYCEDADEISPVVYFVVTDGDESICQQIEEAIQARLRLIGLADIANTDIYIRDVPTDRNIETHPCIVISPVRETIDPAAGVLHMDDVVYSERISIFANDNQGRADSLPGADAGDKASVNGDKYRMWIEQIRAAFSKLRQAASGERLAGVPEVIDSAVVPGVTIPPLDWLNNRYVGELIVKLTSRESRGL